MNKTDLHNSIIHGSDVYDLRNNFIETLAHDLKTPIIAQIRVLDLLVSGHFGILNSKQTDIINTTLDSCKYMYEMVSTLISTYRFENEDFKLNMSYFNLIKIIEDSVNSVKLFLKTNNIKIVIVSETDKFFIFGDEIRLKKVFESILFNSLNFSFKNSIIKIYIKNINNSVSVTLENQGCYISPDKFDSLFKMQLTKNFDKIGSGIGLYLAKKIVEKHNGKIIAKSDIRQKIYLGFEIPVECCSLIKNCV